MWLSSCCSRLHTGAAKATQMKQPLSLKKCAKTRTWSPKQSAINANVVAREKKQQQNQKGWFSGSHETLSACLFMSIILMSTRWFNTSRIQVQQPSLLTFCRIPQMPNGVAWCSQRTARQQPGRCIKRTSDRCTSPGWPVCFSYFFISFIEFHMRS